MLPFTFWTDLGYKKLPSVKVTEGSILTDQNCSINWNLYFSQNGQYVFGASRRTGRHDIRHRQRDVPVLQAEACVCLPAQSIFPL